VRREALDDSRKYEVGAPALLMWLGRLFTRSDDVAVTIFIRMMKGKNDKDRAADSDVRNQ